MVMGGDGRRWEEMEVRASESWDVGEGGGGEGFRWVGRGRSEYIMALFSPPFCDSVLQRQPYSQKRDPS